MELHKREIYIVRYLLAPLGVSQREAEEAVNRGTRSRVRRVVAATELARDESVGADRPRGRLSSGRWERARTRGRREVACPVEREGEEAAETILQRF